MTTWEVTMHSTLSRRARFDIATIITAGVASTVFFLLPLWTSVLDSTASSNPVEPRIAAMQPAADSTIAPSPLLRAGIHTAPGKRRAPAFVRLPVLRSTLPDIVRRLPLPLPDVPGSKIRVAVSACRLQHL